MVLFWLYDFSRQIGSHCTARCRYCDLQPRNACAAYLSGGRSTFNYKYCKGYYFRADDEKMHGRAVRLLVTPVIAYAKKIARAS